MYSLKYVCDTTQYSLGTSDLSFHLLPFRSAITFQIIDFAEIIGMAPCEV